MARKQVLSHKLLVKRLDSEDVLDDIGLARQENIALDSMLDKVLMMQEPIMV